MAMSAGSGAPHWKHCPFLFIVFRVNGIRPSSNRTRLGASFLNLNRNLHLLSALDIRSKSMIKITNYDRTLNSMAVLRLGWRAIDVASLVCRWVHGRATFLFSPLPSPGIDMTIGKRQIAAQCMADCGQIAHIAHDSGLKKVPSLIERSSSSMKT
jgi:hypothetical protein